MDYQELLNKAEKVDLSSAALSFGYLGNSLLGRAIPKFTLGHGKLEVLYVGTHHALEWLTCDLLVKFMEDAASLQNGRIGGIPVATLLDCVTYHIIPMLNPDGVEYVYHGLENDNPIKDRVLTMNGGSKSFSTWQANGRGVDLNHNYNDAFTEYKQTSGILSGAPTRFAGEEPESEPEVAYLCSFLRHHTNIKGVISLHTQGEVIYYQSRGVMHPTSLHIAEKIAKESGYRLDQAEGLSACGGLTDWCIRTLGIPSFTIECGLGENPLPQEQLTKIYCDLRNSLFLFPTWI